ncbi:PIN domain-containing protein [Lacunimicrobium album]
MNQLTVIYDACVLYPSPLRSFLMYLAMTDLFRARWSNDIHEEWMRGVQRDRPDFTRQQAERIRDLMNAHVLDCLVSGYETLIPSMELPDPDDRHVLAAAIHAGADVIITFNLKDFPKQTLGPLGIVAEHPDHFLTQQLEAAPEIVCTAAKRHRESLKNPPMDSVRYLEVLQKQQLSQFVMKLREYSEII